VSEVRWSVLKETLLISLRLKLSETTRSGGLSLWQQLKQPQIPLLKLGRQCDVKAMGFADEVVEAW